METIKIGCKLPHGIWLEIIECDPTTRNVRPQGPRVRLRGANDASVAIAGNPNPPVHAYAMTVIAKDFWDKWLATGDNKNFDFIKSGAVFAIEDGKPREAAAKAKDHAGVRTGFEPLDPDAEGKFNDPRMPKGIAADQDQMEKRAQVGQF